MREFALCLIAGFGVERMKIKMNEKAFSSRITQKNKYPNGGWNHDLPEYQLDALTTELWRTRENQGHV